MLTQRQAQVLNFIRSFIRHHGFPPTYSEIGRHFGLSSKAHVAHFLRALERKGCIAITPGTPRGIRLLDESPTTPAFSIPLLGAIAAGSPIPRPDTAMHEGEALALTQDILPQQEGLFALTVKGQSMVDALINDGDIVVLRHTEEAGDGDLVAVWLLEEEETTLKRFYHEGERIRLQPENPTMQPLFVDPRNVRVQGQVVAVIRATGGVA